MKSLTVAFLALALSLAAFGQAAAPAAPATPAPVAAPTTNFTITLAPVTLPGGKASVAGTESGLALTVTPNFDIKEINLVSSGLEYFGGGFNYRLPVLSTALNNASANLNGLQFQFTLEGSVGTIRTPTGPPSGHWGALVGGSITYAINGTWNLGAEIQYAKLPGYANNTYTVAFGPNFHF